MRYAQGPVDSELVLKDWGKLLHGTGGVHWLEGT